MPATAAEQPGPLPAAGEPAPGTVSSVGLLTHVAFSTFDLIRQLICSQNHNSEYLHEQQCVFINSSQKEQDERGWDDPAAALVMPDSCSVTTAGKNLVPSQGMPFDTRQEAVLAATCCLRERSLRGDYFKVPVVHAGYLAMCF